MTTITLVFFMAYSMKGAINVKMTSYFHTKIVPPHHQQQQQPNYKTIKYFASLTSNNNNNNTFMKASDLSENDYWESCKNTKNPNDKKFGIREEPYDELLMNTRSLYNKAFKERDSKPLIVLLYNNGYTRQNKPDYPNRYLFGEGLSDQENCPYNCLFTHDNRMLSCADIVLAHHSWARLNISQLRWMRNQRTDVPFAWYEWESPFWSKRHRRLNDIFNLTITYARESELWLPYYYVIPKNNGKPELVDQSQETPPMDHAKGKTKMVITLMSHCVGYRINFIKKLQKHLQIDFFGKCNVEAGSCSRSNAAECDKKMKQYKFYLALENSYCKDYHTEKFYNNGLIKGLVPITFKAFESSWKTKANRAMIAPPNSYINILDYPDIKSFAKHLNYLNNNDTAYNEYHAWRKDYKMVSPSRCSVCQQMHEYDVKKINKEHPSKISIEQFWNKGKKCTDFRSEMFQKYLK